MSSAPLLSNVVEDGTSVREAAGWLLKEKRGGAVGGDNEPVVEGFSERDGSGMLGMNDVEGADAKENWEGGIGVAAEEDGIAVTGADAA